MGLKEDWSKMSGREKMMIIGGGGTAVFFLITAIRNKNSSQNQVSSSDSGAGPQTAAIDPSASIDSYTQQMQQMIGGIQDSLGQYLQSDQQSQQQNMQALQDLVQQNQQATIQTIQGLTDKMSSPHTFDPVPVAPKKPTNTTISTKNSQNQVSSHSSPTPQKSSSVVYKAFGTTSLNSSLWGLSKMYLMNHGGIKNPTNSQIQTEVNKVANLNHIQNPNKISKGQSIKMN